MEMMSASAVSAAVTMRIVIAAAKRLMAIVVLVTGLESMYSRLPVSSSPAIAALPSEIPSAISVIGMMLA